MYKFLGAMLDAAGLVGDIEPVRQTVKGQYTGDEIRITGNTEDGRVYELELTVHEKRDHRD